MTGLSISSSSPSPSPTTSISSGPPTHENVNLKEVKTLLGPENSAALMTLELANTQEAESITENLAQIGDHKVGPPQDPKKHIDMSTLFTSGQTSVSKTVTDKKAEMAQANMEKGQALTKKKSELENKIKNEKGLFNRLLNILGFGDAGKLKKVLAELKACKEDTPLHETLKAQTPPPADMSADAPNKLIREFAQDYSKDLKGFFGSQQSKGKLDTLSMDDLKDAHTQLTAQLDKFSDSKIAAFAEAKKLLSEDINALKTLLQQDIATASKFKEDIATAATATSIQQLSQNSAEDIQILSTDSVTAELKDLGCTPQQCDKATQTVSGLKTVATQYGTSEAEAGTTFDLLTPANKLSMASFCQTLGSSPESKLLLKRAGSEIKSAGFDAKFANAQAKDLTKGDFQRLTSIQNHVDNTALSPTGEASHRLDSVVLKAALLLAPDADKEMVMIQHTLEQTKTQLSSMKFNIKGKTESLRSMSAFKFDDITVKALLNKAKPEDKAHLDLMVGYAMILQDKLDNKTPMEAPASRALAAKLKNVGIDLGGDMIKQCVESGFKNSSEVSNALNFVTQFSARISSRPEFMEIMQSLVEHPLTEITSYQAAVVKQSLGMGGIDTEQAAAFIQLSSTLTQKVIESKGAKSSSVQDTAMGALKSFKDLEKTLSQSVFAFRKGISTIEDRLARLDYDTEKLETATKKIGELSDKAEHIQKIIDGLSSAALPKGVEIRHVRQFNNAKLAEEEVKTLSSLEKFSRPTQELIPTGDARLQNKLDFSEEASILSKSSIPFKSEDMPSVFKSVQEGDKTYLGLFQLAPNTEGHLKETFIGYVDPQANAAYLTSYSTNATSHINHSAKSEHSRLIEVASEKPTFKPETALQKDRLVAQDRSLQSELQPAIALKTDAEKKLALNMGGDTETIPPAQKSIRLAISELCRESLIKEGPQSFDQKMSDFTKQIKTNPEMQTKISEKIESWGMPPITTFSLVKKECLQFEGISSFRQWTTEVEPKKSANTALDLTAQTSRQSKAYRNITNQAKLKAQEVVGGLRNEGDSINVKLGGRWEVTTGAIGKAAMAAFTVGVAAASLTAKKEEADAVVLKKTGTGFRLEMNETTMKSLGINTVFVSIAAVGVAAGRKTDVGYNLDFDSSHKASEFLWALTSGNMESVKDASCLGMASAIQLSTGKSINLSAGAGIQISPPIPGLGEQNFGSIQLQVAGEKREQILENKDSRTVITTTSSTQGVAFEAQGLGKLVALATNEVTNRLRNGGYIKGENVSSAALKKSESVSVTHSNSGLLQDYSIKEQISCGMFGLVQMGSFNFAEWVTSQMIPDKMQGEEKQYDKMEDKVSDKLDTLTKGNSELKIQVLELIHRATPEKSIGFERKLAPDTLFELNGLLSSFDEGNAPKSADQMKKDKVAAQKLIDTPSNYVITGLSLSSITQLVDNSHLNAIAPLGMDMGSTGLVDKIDIVQGGYTTLESISFT